MRVILVTSLISILCTSLTLQSKTYFSAEVWTQRVLSSCYYYTTDVDRKWYDTDNIHFFSFVISFIFALDRVRTVRAILSARPADPRFTQTVSPTPDKPYLYREINTPECRMTHRVGVQAFVLTTAARAITTNDKMFSGCSARWFGLWRPAQSIGWKDSSPKWRIMCRVGR